MIYLIQKVREKSPRNIMDSRSPKHGERGRTMTQREFLTAIVNGEMSDEVVTKAQEMLTSIDAKNAKRRESDKPTKASLEAAACRERVISFITANEGEFDADAIAEGASVTKGQVAPALRPLVTDGKVTKSIVKVDSKHRKTVYKFVG